MSHLHLPGLEHLLHISGDLLQRHWILEVVPLREVRSNLLRDHVWSDWTFSDCVLQPLEILNNVMNPHTGLCGAERPRRTIERSRRAGTTDAKDGFDRCGFDWRVLRRDG